MAEIKRYVFIREKFPEIFLRGYSYPYLVYAFDQFDKCGFTPQDWNITWTPDNNYQLVSKKEFIKIVSKEMKSCTTHFDTRKYCIIKNTKDRGF